jgi:hypothetical protein
VPQCSYLHNGVWELLSELILQMTAYWKSRWSETWNHWIPEAGKHYTAQRPGVHPKILNPRLSSHCQRNASQHFTQISWPNEAPNPTTRTFPFHSNKGINVQSTGPPTAENKSPLVTRRALFQVKPFSKSPSSPPPPSQPITIQLFSCHSEG